MVLHSHLQRQGAVHDLTLLYARPSARRVLAGRHFQWSALPKLLKELLHPLEALLCRLNDAGYL